MMDKGFLLFLWLKLAAAAARADAGRPAEALAAFAAPGYRQGA